MIGKPDRHAASRSPTLAWSLVWLLAVLAVAPTGDPVAASTTPSSPAVLADLDSLWAAKDYPAFQAALDSLWPGAVARRDTALQIGLLVRRGAFHSSFGQALQGEEVLRRALALAEARADSASLCPVVRWLGVAVGMQGRNAEARSLYERLLQLARRRGDRQHEGWARIGLAWDASLAGRAEEAGREYRTAAELLRGVGDREGEIWALNGLGIALGHQQRFTEARACYQEVVARSRDMGFTMAEAMALNNLGDYEYQLGDPGLGEAQFARARELQHQLGHLRETVIPTVNLALCQLDLGRDTEAERNLRQCLDLCREQGYRDYEGIALVELARLNRRREHLGEAMDLFREALALGADLPLEIHIRGLIGLSDALAVQDSSRTGLAVLEEGARLLRDHELGELRLDLETALGRRNLELSRFAVAREHFRRVERLGTRLGLSGRPVTALALAARCERSLQRPDSALALLSRAARVWEVERGLPLDPEWREQRGAASRLISSDLADLLLDHPADLEAPQRIARAFDRVQIFKARTLRERMQGPGAPEAAGLDTTRATLQRVQAALTAGELFLDLYLGPRVSLLFAVTSDAARGVRLPSAAELEPPLRRLHELLVGPAAGTSGVVDPQLLARTTGALGRLLLGGISDLIDRCESIVVAPDGVTNLLPFQLLSGAPGDAGAALQAGPTWRRVPSAAIFLQLRRDATLRPGRKTDRILAVAGGATQDQPALAGSRSEVRLLNRRYGNVTLYEVRPGSGKDIPADLFDHDILHFASHVRIDDQYPWRSAIQLAPPSEHVELQAIQVAGLHTPARLTVLASCSSAQGRILSGEGVLGLSSAFLAAGVPAVVATLWPVDDEVTADLVERFYAGLARGETVAVALRRAQQQLRDRPPTQHPFYWAGFVLLGEGDVTVSLSRRLPPFWWLVAPVLLVIGAALGRARQRRRSRSA